MLAEQRRDQILGILKEKGSVSVNELYLRLRVSRETIRRDITRLASENRLRKTHGGALSVDQVELAFAERMEVNTAGKKVIGRLAATLVTDGASLIVDSGTTTTWLAEALGHRRRLTVYTNDVHVAGRLAGRNDNRVLLLGGEVQGSEGATMGRDTTTMLSQYYTDFAFVGAGALSAGPLLTDYSREAAEVRAQMLVQARTSVLLADYTKFERKAPVRVANLEKITHLIIDRKLPSDLATGFKSLKTEILIAKAKAADTQSRRTNS